MHQDRFKNYLMTGLLVHGVTCALVGEALHLFLDVPAFLLGVLHLPALLRHSPAHLLLARLTLLLVHGAGGFLGNEIAFLLRDIVALLPRNLPAVVLGDVLAELLRDVGADLARHLDVVADLAGHLLALNPLAVRADGVSFLALHTPWNVLALGGGDILDTCLAILLQFCDGTSLHCCDGISEQTSFWTSVHCCSNSVLQFSTGVSSQTFSHFSS